MSEDIDYSTIERWQDAVAAAHGDFGKAQEIWAHVKSMRPSSTKTGGGGSKASDDEWISEQTELDELLTRSGIGEKKRRKYIVDMFYNTEDFERLSDPKYMNSILRVAKVSADKRRMVLMAWYSLDERQVEEILKETYKKPYSYGHGDGYSSYGSEDRPKDPTEIVEKDIMKQLEMKQKKLEMMRAMKEMREIEEELNRYKEEKEDQSPRKVKVPLRDRYGNIIKDAEGKIVYVYIDPQEEYERQKLESLEPVNVRPQEDSAQMTFMLEMMKQQNELLMSMMNERNKPQENNVQIEFMEKMLEQMKADKEQTMMTVQKLQQEIEKKKREEMEERLESLQNGLVEIYKKMGEDRGPLSALEEIRQLKAEYPELFGGRSIEDAKLEMDTVALKNSFELMKEDHKMITGTLNDIKDLYKEKLLNDMRLQTMREEAELRKQGVPLTQPLTPDRLSRIEKKIEGKGKNK